MAPRWLEVLDEMVRTCAVHGREDLGQWLRRKRARLLDPMLRVAVVGEPKQGKSLLVNALVNAPVCAVGDDVTAAVPTVVQHADVPSAALVRGPRAELVPIPVAELARRVPSQRDVAYPERTGHVEVGVPRALLAAGLVLVDAPGGSRADATLDAADTVLVVSDASQELSAAELDLLGQVTRSHPRVVVALTKIDMSPDWRRVAERSRGQLRTAGLPATLIPVSSALRLEAARTGDRELNAESGFPDLIARLTGDLAGKRDDLARATVSLVGSAVVEELAGPLQAELSTADSGASAAMTRLHEAQRRLDELRRCAAQWQNTLVDDMTDLMSDIEYDLRDRTRAILRQVDEVYDQADPEVAWQAFERWLGENLLDAAETNFAWLIDRCNWVTKRLTDGFRIYGYDVSPPWTVEAPADLSDRVPALTRPQLDRFTVSQKLFTGLRGSYGGVLMFGLATSLAGMPLINPISIGVGALFGGKTVHDEGKVWLRRRQAAAKAAVQRHVDDVFLRLSKECKDTVRQVQRMLRDHFTDVTEELHAAIVSSVRDAKHEANLDAANWDRRHRQIRQELTRLGALYDQVGAL